MSFCLVCAFVSLNALFVCHSLADLAWRLEMVMPRAIDESQPVGQPVEFKNP